jgi:hypothetical protein
MLLCSREIGSVCAPRLDLCERRNIVYRWLYIPHLVRVDHEHRTCRTGVLPRERRALWVPPWLVSIWEVLWIVNDRADQPSAPQVVGEVRAHFYFEVVEARLDCLYCQAGNLVVGIPWKGAKCQGSVARRRAIQ